MVSTGKVEANRGRALWTVLLFLVLLLGPGRDRVRAQAGVGQVTQLTITQPDPAATQQKPLRTSRDFFVITFSHNGGSGSYFVNTDGADIEGSTFDGGPNQSVTEVAAGFDQDTIQTINLVLFQTRFNITLQTTNPVRIQFDSKPPDFQVQRVVLNQGTPPVQFAAGQTLFTSQAALQVQGTVTDPDNGSPSEEITFNTLVDGQTGTFQGVQGGTFDGTIQLQPPDGEKIVFLTAEDAFPDDPQSRPNISNPAFQIRVVLDTEPAQVTRVVIIRNPDDPTLRTELSPGAQTFVGRDLIQIRVEFSEPLRTQPELNITQTNGVAIRATPLQNLAIDNRIFTWSYTPVPQDDQNGDATLEITGVLDRAGNQTQGDPLQQIQPAFKVDTIPPTRIRFAAASPGNVVSEPRDGDKIGDLEFPRRIRAFVDDYDSRDTTVVTKANASGVLFLGVERAPPQQPQANPRFLTIRLQSPTGQDVPGTPSIAPPNGLFLDLPDFRDPSLQIPGFRDRDNDGDAEPEEGTWRIQIGIRDQVGNTSIEEFLFIVDTTPIRETDLRVTVTNPDADPNPLVAGTPSCVGGPDLRTASASPTVIVSSTDPTFSSTSSRVEILSRLGGRNAAPVGMDADVARDPATGVTLTNLREAGRNPDTDNFPVPANFPATPGAFLPPGLLDPRLGIADGIYLIRVTPVDDAGNRGVIRGNGVTRDSVDYEFNLDTVLPFTRRTFPADNTSISEPLRFVDAIIVDPASPNNGNEGCGIDLDGSNLQWFLETPYRPNKVDRTLIDGGQSSGRLRTTLRFIHVPNSTDPTLPSFNPNDDAFRVLLELTDNRGIVRSLPVDGSMDGIYRILSLPRDRAGNQMDDPGNAKRGNYFGLAPSAETTLDIANFFFLYDTIDPEVTVTNLPDGAFIGGTSVNLSGTVQDLSANEAQPTQGGSGIERVELVLEVIDVNGNPIPGIAPTQSTTTDNPAVIVPGRSNPVVPATRATLTPLADPRNDPVLSSTNPLDPATFPTSQRELRGWTASLALPSRDRLLQPRPGQQDSYRLTITAVDFAGNRTVIRRRVIVSLDHLRPPQLQEPVCGSFRSRPSTTFTWAPVGGATAYTFELTDPNGNVFRRVVTLPTTLQNLSLEGQYRWRVATMDAAGNLGPFSNVCTFTLDRSVPSVLSVEHMDPIEPNSNNGIINTGDVIFTVRFSEPLATAHPVGVLLDPQGGVGVPALEVTTQSFSGDTWVGRINIPRNADPARWDGLASLVISGARDAAGNVMPEDRTRTVEIDTGPFFTTRFFLSPLQDREVTVTILASEPLHEPPTLSNLSGASLIDFSGAGARPRANPISGNTRASFVTLRLNSTVSQPLVSFEITGEDQSLNSARRTVSFQVIRPTRESATGTTVARSASGLTVEIPAGATGGRNLFVFPPVVVGGTQDELRTMSQALASEQGGGIEGQDELLELGFTDHVQGTGPLKGRVGVRVPLPREADGKVPECGQVGLYQLLGGRWTWIGGCDGQGGIQGTLEGYGAMKLARDPVPPRVRELFRPEAVETASGAELAWEVYDGGSGIEPARLEVLLDGKPVPHRFDTTTGEVKVRLPDALPAGEHQVLLAVRDRGGNEVRTQPMALAGGGHFGFSDPPLPVPNPARTQTRIRFDLTQPGATRDVDVEIFDTAGRRIRVLSFAGIPALRNNAIDWDLRDSRGRGVTNGVYPFRIRARGGSASDTRTGKIAVLR